MTGKNLALALTALATTGVLASACSKKKTTSTPSSFTLADGSYNLSGVGSSNGNTCYTATGANSAGIATIDLLPALGAFSVSAATISTFSLLPPTGIPLIPTFSGTITGDTIAGSSVAPTAIQLTTSCTLDISGTLSGTLTANNSFTSTVTLDIAVAALGSNGLAGTCASYANSAGLAVVDSALPFPTLSPANTGSCTAPITGTFTGP